MSKLQDIIVTFPEFPGAVFFKDVPVGKFFFDMANHLWLKTNNSEGIKIGTGESSGFINSNYGVRYLPEQVEIKTI